MSSLANGCYCGLDVAEASMMLCDRCKKFFHLGCLKSGRPSPLEGDILYQFVCEQCSESGEEEFERLKLQWLQVVMLSLYNLQLSGMGKYGYFRWKEHICAFIDKHWTTFFGFSRKKTSLWYGTVAGTLSSGCPAYFLSGAQELNEPGWWRLAEMKPPALKLDPPSRLTRRYKIEMKEQPVKVESLRSRRGKTSIEAAMELKAKRSTLTEAKDLRKSRISRNNRTSESSVGSEERGVSVDSPSSTPGIKGQTEIDTERNFSEVPATGNLGQQVTIKTEVLESMEMDSPCQLTSPTPSSHHIAGKAELEEDTSSQFSHSSSKTDAYLTERDLWAVGTVPQFLLKDDEEEESDSDLEIDPGTFSPPRDSPIPMSHSPSLHDILSSIDDSSSLTLKTDASDVTKYLDQAQVKEEDAESVVSSSSEDSRGVGCDASGESRCMGDDISRESRAADTDTSAGKLSTTTGMKEGNQPEKIPEIRYIAMSHYEEKHLLQRLQQASDICILEPHLARLKRKLIVRQLQREHGQPVFNLDAEVRKYLGQPGPQDGNIRTSHPLNPDGLPMSRSSLSDRRVLDRFQVPHSERRIITSGPSSFRTRLVGREDNQLQPITSPYTTRTLKPFIRRDYETKPLKLRLLEEIKTYPHRGDKAWIRPPSFPIDYCYVRPQHIPSVNHLCAQFFWPGIDLSECLQYPDFSCVVLYRKLVIGFAFMVPDTKYDEAYISFIFTHPEWREAGIATFMLYHLIQTCMGKDVTLHVSATNPAMLLYQKFGFKPEEFILDFYDKYYPVDSAVCKHAFMLRLRR
ncbi:cysteine-rich protein 2-binding protein-like [Liolophura sinensis]|uniref:cysteine-rich protein 2-binding protein-like n=1 Tax=Liolophura sinensis TaxID=3198878 RepID=UPI00315821E2